MFPRTIDRSLARAIAYKRMATGTLGIVAGCGLVVLHFAQTRPVSPLLVLALCIFWAGGIWTLRDGLRLRRELRA